MLSASTLASLSQQQQETGPGSRLPAPGSVLGPGPLLTSRTKWGAWRGFRPSSSLEAADVHHLKGTIITSSGLSAGLQAALLPTDAGLWPRAEGV